MSYGFRVCCWCGSACRSNSATATQISQLYVPYSDPLARGALLETCLLSASGRPLHVYLFLSIYFWCRYSLLHRSVDCHFGSLLRPYCVIVDLHEFILLRVIHVTCPVDRCPAVSRSSILFSFRSLFTLLFIFRAARRSCPWR